MLLKNYQFLRKLQAEPCVHRVILFGSRARGDALERADIDLAIDCPKTTPKEWQKIETIVENADTLLKVDCLRYDTLKETSALKKNIDTEGLTLYVKK